MKRRRNGRRRGLRLGESDSVGCLAPVWVRRTTDGPTPSRPPSFCPSRHPVQFSVGCCRQRDKSHNTNRVFRERVRPERQQPDRFSRRRRELRASERVQVAADLSSSRRRWRALVWRSFLVLMVSATDPQEEEGGRGRGGLFVIQRATEPRPALNRLLGRLKENENIMAAVEAPNGNASTTKLNTTSTSNGGPSATPTKQHHHSFLSRIISRSHNLRVTIQLLDDSQTIFHEFKKSATGQDVLDLVCQHMDLVEKDYFGLRYQDSNKHRYWVDLTKPLSKQIKSDSIVLRLRFRFYPANPILVKEEITRYQLFVQLQRDLLHGRLYCPQNEAAVLAALILQSELGDYDETEHTPGYVSEYKLLLKQSAHIEALIAEAHKNFSGLTPAQAEAEFLTRAARYDTYGFDPYAVKDSKQVSTIYIGVNHDGVLIYQTNHKLHHIKWANVEKVDYVNKQLRIYPSTTYYQEYLAAKSGSSPNVTLNTSFDSNVFFMRQLTQGTSRASGQIPLLDHFTDKISESIMQLKTQLTNLGLFETVDDVGGKAGKKPMLKFVCPSVVFAKHLWRHILSQQAFFTEDERGEDSEAEVLQATHSTPLSWIHIPSADPQGPR
ncbi:hypothetical protein L596_006889 [Steinernema carpocapsae]|uniref:Moesin/ezrin/radixin homolog 1 n=1 Tax=Steinernema carpocapsae TaxID=34508 RepID=A0A4U5P786_STECR|nr:hypothetical protein L596_006889 [Steinernema carpocapsae]